ncbi:MAG: hypothetical protein KGI37_06290 [Alphaproteobacteria bacterium]|nr:hypothetical protein [Alphaproteobacteria bacterium]
MKKILRHSLCGLMICGLMTGAAHAATTTTTTPAKPMTAQQSRMKTCAAEYHAEKIAKSQYHAFMKKCLKTHDDAPQAPTAK